MVNINILSKINMIDFIHLFAQLEIWNKNTYKDHNEVRFPISFGMSPVILFACKSLNN